MGAGARAWDVDGELDPGDAACEDKGRLDVGRRLGNFSDVDLAAKYVACTMATTVCQLVNLSTGMARSL